MMRKLKWWAGVLLSCALIFGMAGQVYADDHDRKRHKGRESVSVKFRDTADAQWAETYIGKMQSMDVIQGYTDGTFQPNKPVTQIEAIAMAVRLMGLEEAAKAKPDDVPLHFKDEKSVPSWARGYVAVALENGLFRVSDDKVQPNKPASRVWIVELLIKALDQEQEALKQMSNLPDFKDIKSIPAGAIGYVNVAVDLGITTGYPNGTFGPNKPVTRGEMAAFLYRTNEERLDNEGAVVVQGKIRAIKFNSSVTDDVYGREGSITVQSHTGSQVTFKIDSNLVVEHNGQLIRADQLRVDDIVTLVALDGTVVDAVLVEVDQDIEQAITPILEFEVEIEADDLEWEIKYKNKKGRATAEIEYELDDKKRKIKGEEALTAVQAYLDKAGLTSDMSKDEIVRSVLTAIDYQGEYEELEIEIKFADGKKVEIELEDDDRKKRGQSNKNKNGKGKDKRNNKYDDDDDDHDD